MATTAQTSHTSARLRPVPVSSTLLQLRLDRGPGAPPLYRQIYTHVRAAILAGTLASDTRLPPERTLAAALGVNRTTVMHAFGELAADGLVVARPGRGTRVRSSLPGDTLDGHETIRSLPRDHIWLLGLPALSQSQLGLDAAVLRHITDRDRHSSVISFAGGTPGPELIPIDDIREALDRALTKVGAAGLDYAAVEGMEELRCAISSRLATQGLDVSPDEVMIVSGATQGIALLAQALLEPGDTVVVEAPTYVGALQTFAMARARIIGLPVDDQGLRVDALETVLARERVRFIFVQPNQQNPTGTTLSPARRERLLWLSRRHGVPIVEDNAYGELWHVQPGPRSLKSADHGSLVMTIGTFSKTLAPGLRIGWITAPVPIIGRFALIKQFADLSSGALSQLAIADMLTQGVYDEHLIRVRRAYLERREAMVTALTSIPTLTVSSWSRGGFYLWCHLASGYAARLVAAAAFRGGVPVLAGDHFYPPADRGRDDGSNRVRLSFAGSPPCTIVEGVALLARVFEHLPPLSGDEPHPRSLRPLI